jgi:hypothetical protein
VDLAGLDVPDVPDVLDGQSWKLLSAKSQTHDVNGHLLHDSKGCLFFHAQRVPVFPRKLTQDVGGANSVT